MLAASSASTCDYISASIAPVAIGVCNAANTGSSEYGLMYSCNDEMVGLWMFAEADCTGTVTSVANYSRDTYDTDCSGKTGCGSAVLTTRGPGNCEDDEETFYTTTYVIGLCQDDSGYSYKTQCDGTTGLKYTVYSSTGCSGDSASTTETFGCEDYGVNVSYSTSISCTGAAGSYQPVMSVLASLFFMVFYFSQ